MPVCTKCPHGVTNPDGSMRPKYVGLPYEDVPCSSCGDLVHGTSIYKDSDRSNKGKSVIQLESLRRGDGQDFDAPAPTHWGEERPSAFENCSTACPECGETVARALALSADFARTLVNLDWRTHRILAHTLTHGPDRGLGLVVLAAELQLTEQGVFAKLKSALEKHKTLRAVLPSRSWAWIEEEKEKLKKEEVQCRKP